LAKDVPDAKQKPEEIITFYRAMVYKGIGDLSE
jgi:hypothetical protein